MKKTAVKMLVFAVTALWWLSAAAFAEDSADGQASGIVKFVKENTILFILIAGAVTLASAVFLFIALRSKRKQSEAFERMYRLMRYDELTGIYNKQTFCVEAAEVMKRFGKENFVIFQLDIDRFRVFNNIFGMGAGDDLLKKIARDLKKLADKCGDGSCLCAHFEADHFVVCIRKDMLDIEQMVDYYTNMLNGYATGFEIMPSFGFYFVKADDRISVSEMCDRAYMALSTAKQNYLQRYGVYDEMLIESLQEEQLIVSEMNAALHDNQFKMYLQPQYDHSNGKVVGAEALVRWNHPERGMVSPGLFIPVFEKNGFITKLDEYIWESACRQLRSWLDTGGSIVPISVNISRVDVYNCDLPAIFGGLVEKYDIPKKMLKLEITESAYVGNPHRLIEVVGGLREQGFIVEMDDFGSGYSSLNTLKEVPVDVIKLDLRFLMGEDPFKRGGCILISIVNMAHWMRLPVIAEGVETEEQADYLLSIGCKYVQGRYYGGAMTVDEFSRLLENNKTDDCRRPQAPVTAESSDFWSYDNLNNLLFNRFMDAAAVLDCRPGELEALRINKRFAEETGIEEEQLLIQKKSVTRFIHPEDRELFKDAIKKCARSRDSYCVCRWQKGENRYVLLNIELRLLSFQEERRIILCKVHNIDEETKLRLAVEEKNRMLDAIIRHMPAEITLLYKDKKGVFHLLFSSNNNSCMESISDDVMRREDSLIDPSDIDRLESALDGKEPFELEFRAKSGKDGIWHSKSCSGEPIKLDGRDEPVTLMIASESNGDKSLLEDREIMRRLLKKLLSGVSAGVVIATRNSSGQCADYANRIAFRILGAKETQNVSSAEPICEFCGEAWSILDGGSTEYTYNADNGAKLSCGLTLLGAREEKQVLFIVFAEK